MLTHNARSIPEPWRAMGKVFEALGDPQRQCILLSFEAGEHLNVSQIAEGSALARSTVSHHLKVLFDAQVLGREKIGKEVFFWVNTPFLEQTFGNVLDYVRSVA